MEILDYITKVGTHLISLTRRQKLFSWIILVASLPFLFAPSGAGFMSWTHPTITEQALERLGAATLKQWEGRKLILGSKAVDRTEGGWPYVSERYDPRFHFDSNPDYSAIRQNFQVMMRLARENLTKPERDPYEFGKILHAIEDFYSHSNYLSLYGEYRLNRGEPVGSVPTLENVLLHPHQYPGLQDLLTERLRTGSYPNHDPVMETDHGNPLWVGPGLNKDTGIRKYNSDAKETAETAVVWYLRIYMKDPRTLQDCFTLWGVPLQP